MFDNDWLIDWIENNEDRFAAMAMGFCLVASAVVTALVHTLS